MITLVSFRLLTWTWIGIALLLIPVQVVITAPYGRHSKTSWGPTIDNRLGWVLMEIVSPLAFGYFFLTGDNPKTGPAWLLFALWMGHYLNRSLIFPLRLRTAGKRMPVAIAASAVFFNLVNGSLNGYWLGTLGAPYSSGWWTDPRFLAGLSLFLTGAAINNWADNRLIHLRRQKDDTGYRMPSGGLFRFLSCPNHFGEIIEWTGFALLAWNLPALAFAVWTAANLIPRALAHHRWYRAHFPDYPPKRKAVIPGVL